YFHVNQRRGLRWNTSKAFLRPVHNRPNLRVATDAAVERLLFEDRRVGGLEARLQGAAQRFRARREVILAAGAIGTPVLLQRSGIGPGALLHALGIPVVHELRGVGENLQDHLQIRCAYEVVGVKTMNERYQSALRRALFALEYALLRRGPMTMA